MKSDWKKVNGKWVKKSAKAKKTSRARGKKRKAGFYRCFEESARCHAARVVAGRCSSCKLKRWEGGH